MFLSKGNSTDENIEKENENLNYFYFGYHYNEKLIDKIHSNFTLCPRGKFIPNGGENTCQKCLLNGQCQGGYIPVSPVEKVNLTFLLLYLF